MFKITIPEFSADEMCVVFIYIHKGDLICFSNKILVKEIVTEIELIVGLRGRAPIEHSPNLWAPFSKDLCHMYMWNIYRPKVSYVVNHVVFAIKESHLILTNTDRLTYVQRLKYTIANNAYTGAYVDMDHASAECSSETIFVSMISVQ